jgi:hypothetical protein
MGKGKGVKPALSMNEISAIGWGKQSRQVAERPFADWDLQKLNDAEQQQQHKAVELESEIWRRPGGSGLYPGQGPHWMPLVAIDADHRKFIVMIPSVGLKALSSKQFLAVVSGHAPLPSEPDKKPPPQPFDYGQNCPAPAVENARYSEQEGRPLSVAWAEAACRLDQQRDHMSEIRPETDIVEFERLWAEQLQQQFLLSSEVEAAGGFEAEQGAYGARYTMGPPAYLEAKAMEAASLYQQLLDLRAGGSSDAELIALLESHYKSAWGGPPAA